MSKRIPKQSRSIDKYEKIIRTLGRIISEDSYLETSTHKIAKQSGVGVGTLYEYFDSKEDILLALFERKNREVWAKIESEIPLWLQMDSITALEEFAKLMVELADENRGIVKVLLGQVPGIFTKEPVIRMLAQVEMVLKLIVKSDPKLADRTVSDTNTFIYLNALIGILLGIANGLPVAVSKESIIVQITKIFVLVVDHQEELM